MKKAALAPWWLVRGMIGLYVNLGSELLYMARQKQIARSKYDRHA